MQVQHVRFYRAGLGVRQPIQRLQQSVHSLPQKEIHVLSGLGVRLAQLRELLTALRQAQHSPTTRIRGLRAAELVSGPWVSWTQSVLR